MPGFPRRTGEEEKVPGRHVYYKDQRGRTLNCCVVRGQKLTIANVVSILYRTGGGITDR